MKIAELYNKKIKGEKMGNSIYQRVIDFTANYLNISAGSINSTDTFEALGIPETDMPIYMTSLEDSFGLIAEPGDANGIVTVDDAVIFIKGKI